MHTGNRAAKIEHIPSVRITGGEGHYVYGYYDNPAFSGGNEYHLVHRVPFCDRLQAPGDTVELGMIELRNMNYIKLAETTAWNFQQGAMLQWNPNASDDEIMYNTTLDGAYRGVIFNIHTRKVVTVLDQPVANVDPTGKYALAINFGRMFDYRPGYGYADITDPYQFVNHPEGDGIYLTDLHSGRSKLILSLDQIWRFIQPIFRLDEAKLTINHINFNTDGTRFVFLARCAQGAGRPRVSALLTANTDGSGLHCLSDYDYNSHLHWKDPKHLLIHGANEAGEQLYLYPDQTFNRPAIINADYFKKDGHCSYSPDRQWILYDSYPDEHRYRHLYLYRVAAGEGLTLGSYYSPGELHRFDDELRCDLHPRWNRDGTAISFDSTHEGQRHVYMMDLRSVVG